MESLGSFMALFMIYLTIAMILWPFVIWSHLREQTKTLKRIENLLKK